MIEIVALNASGIVLERRELKPDTSRFIIGLVEIDLAKRNPWTARVEIRRPEPVFFDAKRAAAGHD